MPPITAMSDKATCYPPAFRGRLPEERVVMAHGAGGMKMQRLIREMFLRYFGNPVLNRLEDSALLSLPQNRLCFTTDGYVVRPLFFPGGNIGKLAVCGTVNDLAVMGAKPVYLALGFILREGLSLAVLEKVCAAIARTAKQVGVRVVTGDTKVIEGSGAEEVYITASGIGVREGRIKLGAELVRPGDLILINGGIGEHEAAIALSRGSYRLRAKLQSDCAPLYRLIQSALGCGGVRVIRDPTRGGLGTTLNEFAERSGLGLVIDEERVPVAKAVRGVADLLGLDPFYMANEGKVVMVVARERARAIITRMRRFATGRGTRVIGAVVSKPKGVWLRTPLGALRRLLMLEGEQLPRIC